MSGTAATRPPLIGIAGWKNSGKTTLAVRLIAEFTARGLRVASIKHAHHAFQIDDGDTDSARHRRAGAAQVAIVSSARWVLVTELTDAAEPGLDEMVTRLGTCDVVIVEGYKAEPIAKIEVRRTAAMEQRPLSRGDPNVIAIAADHAVEGETVPVFQLDDIAVIADFIAASLALARRPARA